MHLILSFYLFQKWRRLVQYHGRDNYIWRCNGKACLRSKKSIRDGSFFGKDANQNIGSTAISLPTLLLCMLQFCTEVPVAKAHTSLARLMSKQTISSWYNFFRETLSTYMVHHPLVLGGIGRQVQIDESYFGGRRKYNRGRLVGAVERPWILGLMDSVSKKVVLKIVPNRSNETLLPLIERHVAPGTHIITDGWQGYNTITHSQNNYTHTSVNHKENFVDPDTGVHTQGIENFWSTAKLKYRQCRGFSDEVRASYIDEIQWRWNIKSESAMVHLMQAMVFVNNPNGHYEHLHPAVIAQKPEIVY